MGGAGLRMNHVQNLVGSDKTKSVSIVCMAKSVQWSTVQHYAQMFQKRDAQVLGAGAVRVNRHFKVH